MRYHGRTDIHRFLRPSIKSTKEDDVVLVVVVVAIGKWEGKTERERESLLAMFLVRLPFPRYKRANLRWTSYPLIHEQRIEPAAQPEKQPDPTTNSDGVPE